MRAIHAPAMAILGIENPELTQGTPDEQLRAMRNLQTARAHRAIVDLLDEVPRKRLLFGRHWIEDTETGAFLRPWGGDPAFRGDDVTSYYVNESGVPIMLEAADPPNRAELERRQASKEQRRIEKEAATKERYRELRRRATT